MPTTIHPTAIVDQGAVIGDHTRIWHWVHVCSGARIGSNCSFGQGVFVGNVTVGNGVKVQNNVSICDGVIIEDEVFCGPSMVFTNVFNPRSHIVRKNEYRNTVVKRRASIGANATIVCGTTIGEYAFIGAGAVINRDVPPHAIMVGVPARRTGWMCACGVRLPAGASPVCAACGAAYSVVGDSCTAC
jgi:UDP-2-acetamido-3-amino-2,3-dideoxy-glucuronate N-acetyltransferase